MAHLPFTLLLGNDLILAVWGLEEASETKFHFSFADFKTLVVSLIICSKKKTFISSLVISASICSLVMGLKSSHFYDSRCQMP